MSRLSYIAPNTDIQFFPDLGLSPSHENTFFFATIAAKDAYFGSLTPLASAASCTYQRGTRGVMRVAISMATLIGAGYCRFKNISFENKWFYAFVDRIEYVNNEVTEVYFTLDNIMTWMGSYTLGQCLVEREHTLSDNVGEHLIDEGLSVGDYVINNIDTITPFHPVLIISTTADRDPTDPSATDLVNVKGKSYYGNMISGSAYKIYDIGSSSTNVQAAFSFIEELIEQNKKDAIISIRIVPAFCAPVDNGQAIASPLTVASGGTFASQYTIASLDGYIPSNKKMFSYPFITYEVINGEGGAAEYRPELFDTPLTPSFTYRGVSFDICEVILVPQGYKKSGLNLVYDEALIMRDFPQASWNIDQYKAYVAQMTSGGGWLNVVGSVASGLLGAASGAMNSGTIDIESTETTSSPAMPVVSSLVNTTIDLLQDHIYYSSLPAALKGTSNANIMAAMDAKSFIGYHKSIMSERARSIDRYFTMYGYKVNLVKTPSCNNRPHYTYVKTAGCIVHGSLPADAAREIESVFDAGVRFWITPSEIGDYTVNNAPGV